MDSRIARLAWAGPCSLVGLLFALPLLAAGAHARAIGGALEVAFRPSDAQCGPAVRRMRFRAITLGHVILGLTAQELAAAHAHERVHVAQYERWGVFFFIAYPAASLWQWLAGRDPYWDNPFEVAARAGAARARGD